MKSIHANLTAAQKTGSGLAIARASLADNGKLHPALFNDSGAAGEYIAACLHGDAIVRVRRVAANNLQYQRITAPGALSQWTTWTSFGFSNVDIYFTIFSAGTHVVIVWRDSSDTDLKYTRSTDGSGSGGGAWSVSAVAYALGPGVTSSVGGVGDSAGAHCGLFFWSSGNADLNWGAYNPGANTWAAASAAGLTLPQFSYVAAAWDSANSRHILAITASGYATGSHTPIAFLTRSSGGAWSAPRVWYIGATTNTTDQGGLRLSQSKIGGFWWLTFWRFKYWTTAGSYYWLACSDDGEYWQEPVGLDARHAAAVSSNAFQVIGELGGYAWAADDRWIYRSPAQSFWSHKAVRWFELHARTALTSASSSAVAGEGHITRLQCEIDGRDTVTHAPGGLADPELLSVLTLERGYSLTGIDYFVSAGTFYVIAFEWRLQDNILYVEATDAAGLLSLWRADQGFRFAGERLDTLVRLVCALAGVHQVSFDGAAVWADTIALYSINPGVSGLQALRSLANRTGFQFTPQEDGSLSFYVPAAGPAASYTYGLDSGEHQHWPGKFGRAASANFNLVLGSTPTFSAEAHDFESQAAVGSRLSAVIYDKRLTSAADAAELAAGRQVAAQELAGESVFTSPPNFALELGDVIAFSSGWAAGHGPWRVTAIEEYFNPSTVKDKFYQRVRLRGTA